MERKSFLKTFALVAATGPMILDGCKKDDASKTTATGTTSTTTTTTSTSGSCITSPTEEEGPYPYPGGEINDPLKRVDVTESTQTGVPLALSFVVVNTNNSCNVITDARIDIWHCNKDGYYSGYANQPGILGTESYVGKTWLRGYQVSDSTGVVNFTTIYPGWYSGRATHIHFEVYINSVLKKIGQVAFSETITSLVYASTLYTGLGVNPTTNSNDSVFGNSATDLANETLTLAGSVSAGYTGTYTIGVAL